MTREEFVEKVKELDGKQGNYELTLWHNKETPERRMERIKKYHEVGIKFFEWALNQGEKVYVYEDVFKKERKHTMFHFVFPEYQMGIRFQSENGFESTKDFHLFLKQYRTIGFIFFIKEDDTLEDVIANFERVKGYYKEKPRRGFLGSIIKPEKKKRPRIKTKLVSIGKNYL